MAPTTAPASSEAGGKEMARGNNRNRTRNDGGTSGKTVAARISQSEPSITLRTYTHVLPQEETVAAERLGKLLTKSA